MNMVCTGSRSGSQAYVRLAMVDRPGGLLVGFPVELRIEQCIVQGLPDQVVSATILPC